MSEPCLYTIDADDVLVRVGGSWDTFADANDAPELRAPAPLRTSLYAFISDLTTAHLYRQVLAKVRQRERAQAFEIRCDGPRVRRFLRLTFSPAPMRAVDVESHLIREETRDSIPLLERNRHARSGLLHACSWCERMNVAGTWYEVEEAIARLRLFDQVVLPAVSHGICEACAERVELQLGRS